MSSRLITVLALASTAALGGVICWLTLTPQDWSERSTSLPADKLAHIAAFAALVLPSAILRPSFLWWTIPLAAALGVGIEVVQPLVGRSQEGMDVVADFIGLGLGAIFGLLIRWYLKRRLR